MTDSRRLLVEYVATESENAFRELVERYINLVYSTARRLVGGDAHLAKDVSQIVFTDLARNARGLSGDVMLGGWLHQRTFHVATTLIRTERRRQDRERRASEMNPISNPSENAFARIEPALDEAILQLNPEDRKAILLRFFEQQDFRSVGEALGSNEDAARMRVTRALEKLHLLLKHRGVTLSATALGAALAAEAVTAAPAGLAVAVSSTAVTAAAAGTGTTLTFLKIMTATNLKLGIISAVLVAGAATPLVIQHQAQLKLGEENQSLRQQVEQVSQLRAENERLSNLIDRANNPPSLSNDERNELLKLRGEIAALRLDSQKLEQLKADLTGAAGRAAKIKERLEQMPEKKIPELQFLTDQEWQQVASISGKLETEADYRVAFSRARERAKELFARWLGQALHNYAKANNGMLPTDLSQLKPYFTPPVHGTNWKPGDPVRYESLAIDDAILQRYQLVQTGKLNEVPLVGTYPPVVTTGNPEHDAQAAAQREKNKTNLPWTEPVVVEKAPVDDQFDSLFTVTVYGYCYKNFGRGTGSGSGTFAKTQLSADGQPILVDPVPAVGRNWSGSGGGSFNGGSGSGGSGSGGGVGVVRPTAADKTGDGNN
jgi:RNA polymerase sigma factor (sigma-70 family)